MDEKKYLSKEKHDELKKELEYLTATRRKEIARDLQSARELGDLSENAEYHQARDQQGKLEGRIYELEEILRSAAIVGAHGSNVVEVGTTVVLKLGNGDERTYTLVGSEEADSAAGRISLNAPLGQALMGRKKGETFVFKTPAGKEIPYTVTRLS